MPAVAAGAILGRDPANSGHPVLNEDTLPNGWYLLAKGTFKVVGAVTVDRPNRSWRSYSKLPANSELSVPFSRYVSLYMAPQAGPFTSRSRV